VERVSLRKIGIAIVGLIALMHLSRIKAAVRPILEWFREALGGFHNFSSGAQTAIAFFTIILLVVILSKRFGKQ